MPSIKLQSSDGEVFPVDVEIAKQSVTIKTMLEDLGMDEDDEEVVPLPVVNATILKKVIQWATYHKDDPPLNEDDEMRIDNICSWDADFLKVDQGTLYELIHATNFLDIKVGIDFNRIVVSKYLHFTLGTAQRDLQDCCQHDQGQDTRGDQDDIQHCE